MLWKLKSDLSTGVLLVADKTKFEAEFLNEENYCFELDKAMKWGRANAIYIFIIFHVCFLQNAHADPV